MIKTYLRGVRDDFKQNRPNFILTPDESSGDIENQTDEHGHGNGARD